MEMRSVQGMGMECKAWEPHACKEQEWDASCRSDLHVRCGNKCEGMATNCEGVGMSCVILFSCLKNRIQGIGMGM